MPQFSAHAVSNLRRRAHFDLDIGRRNCDAAIERSPPLESLRELRALSLRHAVKVEAQVNSVEDAQVGSDRVVPVDRALDFDRGRSQQMLLFPGDDLHELDPASGDAGQEELCGSKGLARTAIPDRTVDDKVVIA
jgi:hypothetical protein